jgi:hypothetical protein
MAKGRALRHAILASFLLMCRAPALGQQPGRLYDPATVETIVGEVVRIDQVTHGGRGGRGVHLLVKTSRSLISVHLGPAWYLAREGFELQEHEAVRVTGSRVILDEGPALIAAAIEQGGRSLRLRDEGGLPVWSRAGPR